MSNTAVATSAWTDNKRYVWQLGMAVPILAAVGLWSIWQFHAAYGMWALFVFFYVCIPVMDWVVGEDRENPPDSMVKELESDRYYSWILYAFVPLQYGVFLFGCYLAATADLAWYDMLGLMIGVGIVGGFGINTAHELGHKKDTLDRWLARICLAQTGYGHFYVEHNRGHHKNVSTPLDPASSRMGETFWAFLPRTVLGSARSAWHLEAERLARQGRSAWNWRNENLQSWAMTVVLFGAMVAWLGPRAIPFLIVQGVYGFSLLEVVNYLEHYGLMRKRIEGDRFERCLPEHSWNSNHVVTNVFLYHLQRHSDHHAHPARRYQALRHFEHAPQLPSGYAAMLLLAYVPPLWFKVMDKRLLNHYQGDFSRIHMHEPVRQAVMTKYGEYARQLQTQAQA
ncbi:MAG: alkane 1-monooxygenase [Burkholderiales bacterium]|nr:alkane 1-monooxygenase [Burkholderiales bacterium]MDE2432721.1 alkane 1-monooxygenase [Burkholderiales bacterium]